MRGKYERLGGSKGGGGFGQSQRQSVEPLYTCHAHQPVLNEQARDSKRNRQRSKMSGPLGSIFKNHYVLNICRGQTEQAKCLYTITVKIHGIYSPWNSPDQNTGVGCCSLLQGSSNAGIEPRSPALQVDFLPPESQYTIIHHY